MSEKLRRPYRETAPRTGLGPSGSIRFFLTFTEVPGRGGKWVGVRGFDTGWLEVEVRTTSKWCFFPLATTFVGSGGQRKKQSQDRPPSYCNSAERPA
jgi:hypothetical protein